MPFTYAANLKPEPDKTGKTHAVRIRVTKDQKSSYYNTGIHVPKKHWNPAGEYFKANWLRGYPMAGRDNDTVKAAWDGLYALGTENPTLSARELRELYRRQIENPTQPGEPEKEPCFLALLRKEIEIRKLEVNTSEGYASIYNKLDRYCGGSLPLSNLTVEFIRGYIAHLQGLGNGEGTIHLNISTLKSVARVAMVQGLLDYAKNPFHHIKVKKSARKKEPLTLTTLQELAALELSGKHKQTGLARDIFMTQFYIHGGRIGDALELKWADVQDRLRYRMRKSRKDKALIMTDELVKILERHRPQGGEKRVFVFPVLDASYLQEDEKGKAYQRKLGTMFVNYHLKKIAGMLEVDRFTSHAARHTFANEALKHADTWEIKKMLNHSSITTTENYLRDLREGEDDQVSELIYKVKPE